MTTIPQCFVIPSMTGKINDCIQIPFPSATQIFIILIISWIIFMIVAYGIYYFISKQYPQQKVNYWIILGILIVAGIIISILGRIFHIR